MAVQYLSDLPNRNTAPIPWVDVKDNLPWGDIEFSRRMLREHLNPTHDSASRRPAVFNAQLAWVVSTWFQPRNVKSVLDLTCGPGQWTNALARMGYTVKGIDVSPAAIDHARSVAKSEELTATFIQADVREAAFGSGFDAALFVYGEANAMKWEEFALVLLRVKEALNPEGILILELSPPEAMSRRIGSGWETHPSGGLFGERPYLSLNERFWNPDDNTSCRRYFVVDLETARVREYGVSYQTYRRNDLEALAPACGLRLIAEFDSLTGQTGVSDPEWHVVVAERPPD